MTASSGGATPTSYGAWPTPVRPEDLSSSRGVPADPLADGDDLYWLQTRPESGGRVVLVRRTPDGTTTDLSPATMSVRSRVHEYGGGAYAARDTVVLAVDFSTQRLWRLDGEPRPLTVTTEGAALRWAAMEIDTHRGLCWAVREDHRDAHLEPVNELVRLDLDATDQTGVVVVAGRRRGSPRPDDDDAGEADLPDFVGEPVLSPDRGRLAWVQWSHPAMPWEAGAVMVGELDAAGDLSGARRVDELGGEHSAGEPVWVDEDRLAFLADPAGWAVPHVVDVAQPVARPDAQPVALAGEGSEFGLPAWLLRRRAMTRVADGRLVAVRHVDGVARLSVVDPDRPGDLQDLDLGLVAAEGLYGYGDGVLCEAGFAETGRAVIQVDLASAPGSSGTGAVEIIQPRAEPPAAGWVPRAEPVTWTGHGGDPSYGFLYRPTHPDAHAPEGELPPLMVIAHGGPNGSTTPELKLDVLYFTSRGIAVLDVNYAGSVGYGRAYRRRLDGLWGIADIEDCVLGARDLAERGIVDGERLGVRGGSAGGYVVLAALTFHDVFTAGISRYGISDLSLLATETHKFESRYPHGLVGPWPAAAATYDARSPLHHLEGLRCPLLLLQGTEDKVVPPSQAEVLADALRAQQLPVAMVMFEGEGHGFREPAAVVRAWELETSFLAAVWGYEPADDPERVVVENL